MLPSNPVRQSQPREGPFSPCFRNVLVVEDDPRLRLVIARNLASRGCRVREAESAEEALLALRAELPDLMLLDINLPDRTGWDVLRELAAAGQRVPTVVCSAVRVSPAKLAQFGPLAYLPKPFPIEALLRLLAG
jgi:DNA-binding response OmpR family regulator